MTDFHSEAMVSISNDMARTIRTALEDYRRDVPSSGADTALANRLRRAGVAARYLARVEKRRVKAK